MVSSAILYLAIVAIWALVLVPRWLHPRSSMHRATGAVRNEVLAPEGMESIRRVAPGTEETLDTADSPEEVGGPEMPGTGEAPAGTAPARPAAPLASAGLSPAARRQRMLQARRRSLGTLALLTLGAVVLAAAHLAAAWIIAPPAIMLAGFLVLLREAALIDAERKRQSNLARNGLADSGADAPGEVSGAPVRAGGTPSGPVTRPEHRPDETPLPETKRPGQRDTAAALEPTGTYGAGPGPDAHVIDISERLDGQFYDQYTDAVDRAVGD